MLKVLKDDLFNKMPAYASYINNIHLFLIRLPCYLPDSDPKLSRQLLICLNPLKGSPSYTYSAYIYPGNNYTKLQQI